VADEQPPEGPWTIRGGKAGVVSAVAGVVAAVAAVIAFWDPSTQTPTPSPPAVTATSAPATTAPEPLPTVVDDANSDSRPPNDLRLARIEVKDEGKSLRPDGTYHIGEVGGYAFVQPHWRSYLSNSLPLTANDVCNVDVTLTGPNGSVVQHVDPSHVSGPYIGCEQHGTQGHYHLREPGIYTLHVKVTYGQDTKELKENITVVR
jgi:hypothetical protein